MHHLLEDIAVQRWPWHVCQGAFWKRRHLFLQFDVVPLANVVKGGANRHRVRVQMPQKSLLSRSMQPLSKLDTCFKPLLQNSFAHLMRRQTVVRTEHPRDLGQLLPARR